MNEPTNIDRADWAELALQAFAEATGQDTSGDWEHDPEQVAGDFLCDLLHLFDAKGWDFPRTLEMARGMHREEVADESDETGES